jgi:hypothetical protein
VVVLPCIVLAVAWWAARYRPARVLVAAGLALGALTFAWLTADVLSQHMTLIVDFERTTNPLVAAWRSVLPDGRLVPPGTDLLRAAWVVGLGLLAFWGVRSVRVPTAARGVAPISTRAGISAPERSLA